MGLEAALEEVVAELARTSEELNALPDDEFGERVRLRDRLNELRAVAAELRTHTPTDRNALAARLERLEKQLRQSLSSRISHTAAGQTGQGGGVDPEFVHQLNRQIDKGQGVAELKAEIERIRALLAED